MRKNKLLLLLALLMTAATGAWATNYTTLAVGDVIKVGDTFSATADCAINDWGVYGGEAYTLIRADIDNGYHVTEKTDGAYYVFKFVADNLYMHFEKAFKVTAISDGLVVTKIVDVKGKQCYTLALHEPTDAPAGYTVTMKDGVKDADKWTVKVGEGQAQALPIGGLKGDGSETVTLQYNGRLKVKGVKATSDEKPAAPSVTEVTTFSELQTALSAGKDVKLKNDIVCTAEINITKGALTIDGNGKKLSTTSEIRAFKVGSSATVAFKNLTLTGFVSGGGPAINNSGTIVLDGCTISNCHVNNSNGGGAIESSGKLYAINTTFSGNYSGEIGGAINNYGGSLYMSGCTFTNNYTTKSNAYWGGAIGINGGDEVRLINCSFSGNQYGTNAGPSDIGVYSKPTNYTIAGCTGATIASNKGDITTNATGTATLDYSDLSNISFTYSAPITVTWNTDDITGSGNSFTKGGVTITAGSIDFYDKNFEENGTFTTTLGNFTKIEVVATNGFCDVSGTGWSGESDKRTWTGNASSVSFIGDIYGDGAGIKFVFTIEP